MWQDELYVKFGLVFTIFTRELMNTSHTGNPFDDQDRLIVRMDQVARSDDLYEKVANTEWDLIIVDEAHKMSASYFGNKINKTKRFQLGELLSTRTRHFLLMTATPHNGKEADFQLFISLLDRDRFYGRFRDGVHQVDITDIMRRMVKEELLKFDGTPLFPERRATTASYRLSDLEAELYALVTDYVKNEMNKADNLDGKRKGSVGFALTMLQRRLASSPEAIYQSLKRRRQRLERRIEDEKLQHRGHLVAETYTNYGVDNFDDADEQLPEGEFEELADTLVDQATAARTIEELESEVQTLALLEEKAKTVVHSGNDRKWEQLSSILQDDEQMKDPHGRRRKLIIFTEHKDTLAYLRARISDLLGDQNAAVTIHGGIGRDERRKIQETFRHDPETLILVATDAAGEGVNLQNASLMVTYDLPWNTQPPGAALWPHSPHRANRDLPPVEHGGHGYPGRGCLLSPVPEAGPGKAIPGRTGL